MRKVQECWIITKDTQSMFISLVAFSEKAFLLRCVYISMLEQIQQNAINIWLSTYLLKNLYAKFMILYLAYSHTLYAINFSQLTGETSIRILTNKKKIQRERRENEKNYPNCIHDESIQTMHHIYCRRKCTILMWFNPKTMNLFRIFQIFQKLFNANTTNVIPWRKTIAKM